MAYSYLTRLISAMILYSDIEQGTINGSTINDATINRGIQWSTEIHTAVLYGCGADTADAEDSSSRIANTYWVQQMFARVNGQANAGIRALCQNGNANTPPNNTIYQNTSGKLMICSIALSTSTGGFIAGAFCDSQAYPTTKVAGCSQVGASGMSTSARYTDSMTFVVPPNYYYGVSVSWGNTGVPGIEAWSEWYLG